MYSHLNVQREKLGYWKCQGEISNYRKELIGNKWYKDRIVEIKAE